MERKPTYHELEQRVKELEKESYERKQAQERVIRLNALLDLIKGMFRETLRCKTAEEVARLCLTMAEYFTGSKFGFIGELNQAGLLDTLALSFPSWEACKMPRADALNRIKNMEVRGLWGKVIRDQTSLIVNNPASHPDRVGTPQGHPPVTSFLGIPLKDGDRTIGLIGLANKGSDYTLADQQEIEALSVAFVEALNRRRELRELQESKAEFSAVIENAPIMMMLLSQGKVCRTNRAVAGFTGRTAWKLIGLRKGEALNCLHSSDSPDGCGSGPFCKTCTLHQIVSDTIESGNIHYQVEAELIVAREGKEERKDLILSTVLISNSDHPVLLICIEDITARKLALKEKERMQAQLFQAQKMDSLGTLVAGVAHEINNPVNSIGLNAQLLQKIWHDFMPILEEHAGKEPDKKYGGLTHNFLKENLEQLLEDINWATNRIARISNSLKNFARQSDIADKKMIEINEAAKNAYRLIHSTAIKSGIDLNLDLGDNLPLIGGNLQSIEQIILNLTINAIQAIDHDRGKVEIVTGYNSNNKQLFVSISDNGRGINPSILNRIFDPFVTDRQKKGGIGLGLSITYSLVKAHKGEITFKSEKDKGTTFQVFFPLEPIEKMAKILIVDDEEEIRKMLTTGLSMNRHYLIEEADNGIEACVKLGTYHPDLLVLDIFMPEMDGLEVCRAIKKEPGLSCMKVIILTGFPDSPKVKQVAEAGFTNIYTKPFNLQDFIKVIDSILKEP